MLVDLGLPIATEILNPSLAVFFSDLVSWGFIGARTCSSQTHRELASALPFPIGFKNTVEGSIQQAIYGMISARFPHHFPTIDLQGNLAVVESYGNPSTHLVLRGSSEAPNYEKLSQASHDLSTYGFSSRILVDCSHGNCQKDPFLQSQVFSHVLRDYKQGNSSILGMMLESNLKEGSQLLSESPSSLRYGVSVTDPCVSWKETEILIRKAKEYSLLSSPGKAP